SIERSLELLGVDRFQLVHLHDPEYLKEPGREPFEYMMAPGGPVEVLKKFEEEGVIKHLGIAGGPVEMLIEFVQTGAFETVITHNRYTLVERGAEPLFDVARERGVAVLNAAPYGSGILAKGPDAYARYEYREAPRDIVEKARAVEKECRKFDVPLAAAALRFSLRDERIASTIVGVSRPERIEQTLRLASHPIPEELWGRLQGVVSGKW
ncbi:MAG: aldo/keto reductase, partial [Rubrobacteraceae bacterium]